MADPALDRAARQIRASLGRDHAAPVVRCFFDGPTNTASYVVHDPGSRHAAIIDSVLDYDPAAGRTSTASADTIIAYVSALGLQVDWILETHVHADHLSAAPHLRDRLGGAIGIGRGVAAVQDNFGRLFNLRPHRVHGGAEFDRLFDDGDGFALGAIPALALHVPGHTPADIAYVIGSAVFAGDTLFMPDAGTARADFPGGDARRLYRSIRRLLALPGETPLFLCHDYKAPGRDHHEWRTSVADQNAANIHVRSGIDEDSFVAMREARDATLAMPRLILPSVQVNMHAGRLPEPEANGTRYLKIPLNAI